MPGEMNPRERWGLLLIDEIPDRPPVYPLVTSHAAAAYGCDLIQYCTDGEVLAEAQLYAQRLYQHEGLSVFTDVGIIAEAMGSKYHLREYEVPILDSPIIQNPEAVEDLRIPDPVQDGRLPVYLEAIDKLYTAAGDILPVFAFIPCPFTTSAGLRGTEEFLISTALAPENAHKLLEISLQAAVKFCDECILAGALPVLVDPLASGSVISRSTFSQFASPYTRRLIEHLHRYDLDIMLHICGDTSGMLDLIPATGADLFSMDKADISSAIAICGDKIRLAGNLPPHGLLEVSRIDMAQKAEEAVEKGITNPKGFVLSTGCEAPIKASPEKLHKIIEIGRKSHYDFKW
ncbi:uroporphyrinogen decarboxylase family protein [bacterium]|nr:uroporphyrinogen decarboxylase family protein [FCB group bacterium]MBL7191713.1 uroporphyrinogen decarboxylase family protein [bacterium]